LSFGSYLFLKVLGSIYVLEMTSLLPAIDQHRDLLLGCRVIEPFFLFAIGGLAPFAKVMTG